MIVTTRIVGYQRSPIDPIAFGHFRLREFTVDQIDEYAERWFGLMGRPELRESFMNESRSVDDLRTNPLMLSLLCSLFKAHGTIPRNRLAVYRRCADLLFHQWDSARQIQQNEDLPDFGNRLMEEIARLFYGSQAAQNGVEEGQLVKIIGTYLQDYAGVPQGAARRRGQEFLDFCAGRAWLLARLGTNSSGISMFGFTHRTFFEYFAAESLARMSDTPEQVADAVMKAYGSDSTSVLPELLIQAYEDKSNRGASRVFEWVSRARIFEADLALRLMNTTLRRDVRRIGFERIVTTWGSPGYAIDQTTFLSLVFLHEEPRQQFIDDYLLSDEGHGPSTRQTFLDGWSALASTGQFSQMTGPWMSAVEEALAKHAQDEIRNASTTSRKPTKAKVNRRRSR
jgi:hypothetical protein